jgi:hypothetical protein
MLLFEELSASLLSLLLLSVIQDFAPDSMVPLLLGQLASGGFKR